MTSSDSESAERSHPAARRTVRRPRAEIVYAAVGLGFSLIAWAINPWFIASLVGIVLSIRAMFVGRRMIGGARRAVLTLGIVGLIAGILAAIGTVLALVVRVG